jgi:uncharacterized protein YjbI with pentapeptide repeats
MADAPDVKRPVRPDTGGLTAWKARMYELEYGLQWVAYGFSQLAIFKIAEYLAKLSVFAAILLFAYGRIKEARQVEIDAQTQKREAIRNSFNALRAENRDPSPQIRQLAFVTLYEFFKDDSPDESIFRTVTAPFEYTRLDLSNLVLRNNFDLSGAILEHAVMQETDLTGAKLNGARLNDAVLAGTILRNAELAGAKMPDAVFRTRKRGATNEWVAVLADLHHADLRRADLSRADLRGADLSQADLTGAVLDQAKLSPITGNPRVRPAIVSFRQACKISFLT